MCLIIHQLMIMYKIFIAVKKDKIQYHIKNTVPVQSPVVSNEALICNLLSNWMLCQLCYRWAVKPFSYLARKPLHAGCQLKQQLKSHDTGQTVLCHRNTSRCLHHSLSKCTKPAFLREPVRMPE